MILLVVQVGQIHAVFHIAGQVEGIFLKNVNSVRRRTKMKEKRKETRFFLPLQYPKKEKISWAQLSYAQQSASSSRVQFKYFMWPTYGRCEPGGKEETERG